MGPTIYTAQRGSSQPTHDPNGGSNWSRPLPDINIQFSGRPERYDAGMMQPNGATSFMRPPPPTPINQSSTRNPLSYLKKLGSSNATPSALNIPPRVPSSQGHRQNSSVGSINKQERGSSAVQGEEYKALEKGLTKFAQRTSQKVEVIKSVLATWLKKNSNMTADMISGRSLDQGRTILLRWWTVLLEEMPDAGYADRSIFFETVIGVMTRVEFQEFDNVGQLSTLSPDSNIDLSSLRRYRDLTYMTLDFAVDRLNQKGVYSNMISFCAKVLAHSFFKLPDVGNKLVRALPVRKGCLRRIVEEMGGNESNASLNRNVMMSSFPVHLEDLCYKDAKSWWRRIETHDDGIMADMASTGVRIEMSGNWIRRWQSDDSELFFSFYKYYHAVLREYFDKRGGMSVMFQYMPDGDMIYTEPNSQPRSLAYLYAPGYAHLAAFFLEKIDSLIHREIYSVTTLTPNASRDSLMVNASALMLNGGGGGRPKVLEVANKRLSDTIAYAARQFGGIFKDMTNVWFRAVVKRTSLWDAEGVFSLVDFADALCLELTAPLKAADKSSDEKEKDKDKDKENRADDENSHFNVDVYFDVTYLFRIITLVLTTTDHTISVMRILSFIYSHFAQLTRTGDAKRMLCLDVLLRADIFDTMFLHWGPMCRAYFMRLLVWRVSRIGLKPPITDDNKKNGKNVMAFEPINDGNKVLTGEILRLLDKRLESVRKRHDRFVEEELGMAEGVKAMDNMFPPSSPNPQIAGPTSPTSPAESIPYSPLSNASSNSDGGTPKKKQKKRPPPLLSESLMTPKVKSPTVPVDRDALLAAGKNALAGNVDAFRQQNSSSGSLPLPSTATSNSSMMSDIPMPKKAMKRFGLGAGVGSDMGEPMRGSSRQSMDSNKNRLAKLRKTFKGAGDRLMRTASSGRFALIGALKADRGSHPRQTSEPAHYPPQQAPQTIYTYQGPVRSSSMRSPTNTFSTTESFSQTASPRHGQFSSHLKLSPNDYRSDLRKSKASLDEEAAMAHASRVMEAEGRRDPYGLEHPPTPKSRRESGYWMDKNGENQLLVEVDESQEQQEAQRRANHEQALSLLETKPPIPDIKQADVIKLLGLPEESPTRTVDPIAEAEAALMGNRVSQLKTNEPLPPLPSEQRNSSSAAANRLSLGDIGLGKSFFSFEFEGSKGSTTGSSSSGSLSAFGEADDFFASVLGSSSSLSSDSLLAPVSQTSLAKRRSAAYMAGLGIDTSDDPNALPSPMFSPPSPGAEVPRLSKHISNRQSLLPPDAYDFLSTMENAPAVPTIPKEHANANTQNTARPIMTTAEQNNSKSQKQNPSSEDSVTPAAPVKSIAPSEPPKPPTLTVGKSNVPLDVGMASMNLNSTLENIPSTPTGYPRQRHIYAKRALVEYEEVVEEYVQWGAQCRKQGLATGKGKADVNEALSSLIPQLMVEWPRYFYGG